MDAAAANKAIEKIIGDVFQLHCAPVSDAVRDLADETGSPEPLIHYARALSKEMEAVLEESRERALGLESKIASDPEVIEEATEERFDARVQQKNSPSAGSDFGKWYTADELKQTYPGLSECSIKELIHARRGEKEVRRREGSRGRPLEILFTEAHYEAIEMLPGSEQSPHAYDLRGKTFEVREHENYSAGDVSDLLSSQYPDVFSNNSVDKMFAEFGWTDQIPGKDLSSFLERFHDVRVLTTNTTRREILEPILGTSDLDEVKAIFSSEPFDRYVQTLPGLDGKLLVQQQDITSLEMVAQTRRRDMLHDYHARFSQAGIMPTKMVYEKLLQLGILDNGSISSIQRTYPEYEAMMDGLELVNLEHLRQQAGVEWDEFRTAYIPGLVRKGLLRDIARERAKGSNVHVYAMIEGSGNQVREAIGIKPVEM